MESDERFYVPLHQCRKEVEAATLSAYERCAQIADEHMTLVAGMGHRGTWPIAQRIAERIRADLEALLKEPNHDEK